MRCLNLSALFVILAILTGCDTSYGVQRKAHIKFVPDPAVVKKIIEATPGVNEVHYQFARGGRPITFQGRDNIYTFFYIGESNVWGVLQITDDYKHRIELSQFLLGLNHIPSQSKIDATRPVMKQVETELENNFGPNFFQTPINEWCRGVKCN